jgi:hypothetical protein
MPFPKHFLRTRAFVPPPVNEPLFDEALMGLKQVIGTVLKESGQIRSLSILAHENRPLNAFGKQTII